MGTGWKLGRTVLGAVAIALVAYKAVRADTPTIYVSYDANGTPRFTSQPYDRTYSVFLKSEGAAPASANAGNLKAKNQRAAAVRASIEPIIQAAARRHHLEPALLRSIIEAESGFNGNAISPKGAVGLMQVMPETGRRYGIRQLADPVQNVEAGARYLSDLLARFDDNLPLTLAAYNAGEGAVSRHARRIPPYRETMLYVPAVLTAYTNYRQADARSR
jgi:soluble lytic murein transglycosylase-like protein